MFWDDFNAFMVDSMSMYGGNLHNVSDKFSNDIFENIRKPNQTEIMEINPKLIMKKLMRFYILRYNYNKNMIWCPILALEIKTISNKNIVYALNFDYLPPKFKIILFSKLFSESGKMKDVFNINNNMKNVSDELPLPLTGELLYKLLKNNGGMNYALTAYDVSKIKNLFAISCKILPKFCVIDCKKVNAIDMKKIWMDLTDTDMKTKMEGILKDYSKLIEEYQEDSIEYHKKLKNFESHLKLIND